jgi:hypothetical protein
MLTLPNVRSDGSVDDAATVDVIIRHPNTGDPTGMVVQVQIAPMDEVYRMARACRKHEKNPATRAVTQVTDGVELQKRLLARFVRSWTGLQGSDGKALPCIPSVMDALPEWVADQITEGIRGVPVDGPTVAEVHDASFRESA